MIDYLSDDCIIKLQPLLGFDDDLIDAFREVIDKLKGSEELKELFYNYHQLLFHDALYDPSGMRWPDLGHILGKNSYLFPALVLISGISNVIDFYSDKNIPYDILKDTLSDLNLWIMKFYRKNGCYGLDVFYWLSFHFRCRVFRLSRLQFMASKLQDDIHVFRNRSNGSFLCLAGESMSYRNDGLLNGTSKIYDEASITAYVKEIDDKICGYKIENGYILKDPVAISRFEWEEILSKGSQILEIHIPEGEKLKKDDVEASIEMAHSFYQKYFRDLDIKAFTCESWLLDPNLQSILPGDSNIIKFQKIGYLYPFLSDDSQTIERVFENELEACKKGRSLTSLQEKILNFINNGGTPHMGAMYIPY